MIFKNTLILWFVMSFAFVAAAQEEKNPKAASKFV